jgi:hypothetical protein
VDDARRRWHALDNDTLLLTMRELHLTAENGEVNVITVRVAPGTLLIASDRGILGVTLAPVVELAALRAHSRETPPSGFTMNGKGLGR